MGLEAWGRQSWSGYGEGGAKLLIDEKKLLKWLIEQSYEHWSLEEEYEDSMGIEIWEAVSKSSLIKKIKELACE